MILSFLRKFTAFLLIITNFIEAEVLVRGALILHDVSGKVSISRMGKEEVDFQANQMPVSMPGLIDCRASNDSYVFFSTSSRSSILFEGDGSFTISRFEQGMPELTNWETSQEEVSQSRVILNFREGQITVDNRYMIDSSQFLAETPLGIVRALGGIWQMSISFDPGKKRFNFLISCIDGLVRFTDFTGKQHSLRDGQRLSGAGLPTSPSIEVGEIVERTSEQIQLFLELTRVYASSKSDLLAYAPYLQVIEQDQLLLNEPVGLNDLGTDSSLNYPIIIEYTSDPPAVTPFRAEVKAPSVSEADLF